MDDNELQQKFDLVAAHLASLAVSQQKAEERQQRADERQQRADERIARLERLLLLAVRAGRRERNEWREQHEVLIDAQIRMEAMFTESQTRTDAAIAQLADAQVRTDRKLEALIDIVREDRERRRGNNGQGQ